MPGSAAREGRTAGLRRLAGPDDGRMYGTSDAGYQAKLGRLTDEEVKANEAATAAHREFTAKLFMGGVEARSGTSEQVACTAELVWVITKHPRLTDGDTELPMVIAVHGWSAGMMGRAGKVVNDQLSYGVAFLGDCAQVNNLNGTKSRTSASIAHHLLQYEFPERLQQGKYDHKKKARAALKEELQGERYLCFVDATELQLSRYDWEEAEKVSVECDAIVVVSVGSKADAPRGIPCLDAPADSTARPRAHLRAYMQSAAVAVVKSRPKPPPLTAVQQEIYKALKEMLQDDEAWENCRKRKFDRLVTLTSEFGKYEHQLAPENTQKLKEARTIIEEGGAYVSDTESEDEKEPELPAGAPLYQENGHHWRCCEMRCVCPNSTGIG
jgi:hypothetical protein